MRSRSWMITVLCALLLLVAVIVWYWRQPAIFQLQVDNRSERGVDQVRLFGDALAQDALLLSLPPGESALLETPIKKHGALRFEVSQGGNRIDTYIVEDVRRLDDLTQRLTIHDNNRFLLDNTQTP